MRRALLILLAVGSTATAACEEFLTINPRNIISRETYFLTEEHMEQAVNHVYATMRGMFGGQYRLTGDLRGDLTTLQLDINVPGFTFQIDEFSEATNDGTIGGHYNQLFNTIFDANVVLSRIDAIEFADPAHRDKLKAEALFARSLAYWRGLQLWGLNESWEPNNLAVPFVLHEIQDPNEAFEIERVTVQEVFDQIVSDLTFAKQHLPRKSELSGSEMGRFTRGAAAFLLGATYQLDPSQASQQAALAEFEELEGLGYALVTSGTEASENNAFREVFNPGNKNNIESIFELQYDANADAGSLRLNLVSGMAPLNSDGGGGGSGNPERVDKFGGGGGGDYMPTQFHILSFEGADPADAAEPFDLRYEGGYGQFCPDSGVSGRLGNVPDVYRDDGDISIRSPNPDYPELNIEAVRDPVNREVRENCIPYYAKWRWPDHEQQNNRENNNWIVFRYADALLRRAESLARLNRPDEALIFVNQVRDRAGLPPLAGLSGEALLDQITQERAWELAGEGHRWTDLKRLGRAVSIIAGPHADDRFERVTRTPPAAYMRQGATYRLRFPIRPQDVRLSQCRILQNPGWASECVGT